MNDYWKSLANGVCSAAAVCLLALCLTPAACSAPVDGDDHGTRALVHLAEIQGVSPPSDLPTTQQSASPDVRAVCERARAQLEDGQFDKALAALAEVRELDGADYYEIYQLTAWANIALGKLDDARDAAEKAARLGHGVADVHYLLGQIYLRDGESEQAIAQFRTATLAADRDLNNVKITLAWYALGFALAEDGYGYAAAQSYERFDDAIWRTHTEHRNAPETAAILGEHPYGMVPESLAIYTRLECYDDALRVSEWAEGVWPDDLPVARWRAEALLSAGRANDAYAFCRERMTSAAGVDALLSTAIRSASAAGTLDQWAADVADRVRSGDDAVEAGQMPRYLTESGHAELAVRVGRALLERAPGDVAFTWRIAAAQNTLGDVRGVIATLAGYVRGDAALREIPRRYLVEWMGWFTGGSLTPEIVDEFKSGADADFATDFVLGVSLLAAGATDRAQELLRSCLEARPGFAPARVAPGEALLTAHNWEGAKEHAQKVLEDFPDLAAAHFLLAEAHDGLDEIEQAEQEYKEAVKLSPDEPAYKLALANHYKRLDNLRSAQRYYQSAFSDDPGSGEALEGLIDCYIRGDKVELAKALLEQTDRAAIPADSWRRVETTMRHVAAPFAPGHIAELRSQFEQHPDDMATARLLAGGLFYFGRVDEASEVINKAGGIDSGDYNLLSLLANVHALRGEFEQAIQVREKLHEWFPNRRAVLEPLSSLYLYEFRVDESRALLRRLMELADDETARAQYRDRLRISYLQFRDFDEALRMVEEQTESGADEESGLLAKASILIAADRNDEAMDLMRGYLEKAPAAPDRREAYYEFARMAGAYGDAARHVRQWLDENPADAALTQMLIDALLMDDRPQEALEAAQEFTGSYTESLQRRIWLGRCQAALGKTDMAVAEFEALLAERVVTDEIRRQVRQQLIVTQLEAERFDEALKHCDAWLAEAGDANIELKFEALLYKRGVLQAAGRNDEYAEISELLLSYRPDNTGFLNDLGYTWADAGVKIERATEMIRRAVIQDPLNAAYLDSLGWAHYKAGRFADARKYLSRGARLIDGQDSVIYDHLGDAAYRQGDEKLARESWEKSVALADAGESGQVPVATGAARDAARAKLAALEASKRPQTAPTAAEQPGEQNGD